MMRPEALRNLALQRAVDVSAAIELALDKHSDALPLLHLLARARERAAIAIVAMCTKVDPTDADNIRKLQNEMTVFRLICEWLAEAVVEGSEAGNMIDEETRLDFRDTLGVSDLEGDLEKDALRAAGFEPED